MAERKARVPQFTDKEATVARENWNRYVAYRERGHRNYVKHADKCDNMFLGRQWDDDDVKELDDDGRPALTINLIMPTINAIKAEHSRRRVDIQFKASRPGKDDVAGALTKLFKLEYNRLMYSWIESQVLMDGLIQDRGYFDVRMDFSENVQGLLTITSLDPTEVIPDPDAKEYDPRTWKDVILTRWVSLEDIEQVYGKKVAKKLEYLADSGQFYPSDSLDFEERRPTFGDDANISGTNYISHEMDSDSPRTVRAARIIERQHRKLRRLTFFVDPQTGDQKAAPDGWNDKKIAEFAQKYGLEVFDKVQQRIRWTVTCDHVVLHDEWSPYDEFTVVPYFPMFRRGRPVGLVTNLISTQEQLNKSESQQLHIVNSTANGGWIVEADSLANMTTSDLEMNGAKTGLVLEHRRGSSPPQKIQPNNIPQGIDRVSGRALSYIRMISGVNDAAMGTEGPYVSGVALEGKTNAAERMMDVPLDTLEQTRLIVARVALGQIQKFYTDERIYYIADEDDPNTNPAEELVINQQGERDTIVNDITLGQYSITIATAPNRDTMDEIQYAEALNMRKIGIAIPDDVVVMYSNLHRRRDVAKRMRLEQGIDMTPEQQEAMQIQNEISMMEAQKQLQLLDAQIAEKMSIAELNMAKAGVQAQQPDADLQKLLVERDTRMEEIRLRERLAQLSKDSKNEAMETSSAAKLALAVMQQSSNERTTAIKAEADKAKAAAKPKPSGAKKK